MIHNVLSFPFSFINLILCLNVNLHMLHSRNTDDSPNVIMLHSRPGLYEELKSMDLSFSIQLLNLTEEFYENGSLLSRLNGMYRCSTLGVIAYCEESAILNIVQMWTKEKRIYFVSYSCTVQGPFAQIENNVFQLDSGMSLYSTAIANNLEINLSRFQRFGIGILIDFESLGALELFEKLKNIISLKISTNAILFSASISGSMSQLQIINQLKKCQEYSVPIIIVLSDLSVAVQILTISSQFYQENHDYIINPFTTLLLTDIKSSSFESLDFLLNISSISALDIQFAKRQFKDDLNGLNHSPAVTTLVSIKDIFNSAIFYKIRSSCTCPPKVVLTNSSLSSSFFLDGSTRYGAVTFYKLSKAIIKLSANMNKHKENGILSECRTLEMETMKQSSHPVTLCDNWLEIGKKQNLRKKIRVLIEYHESLLLVNNRSDSDSTNFTPLMHQVVCRELNHSHDHFCSGLLIHLLESIGKQLDIDFFYFYTEIVPINSITTAIEMMSNTSIQILIFSMNIDFTKNPFLDVTEPFSFLEYAVMADLDSRQQLLGAAFRPFTLLVWIMICVIATLCAVAMALYEWHSPFGLNPWGRQRNINYSLASALTSVWAMMFGHTIHTKAPKSWPVKVLKNFWACACIVIVAMYTANLTVFIAGILQNDICYYYKDGNFKAAMKSELEGISMQLRHMNCFNISSNSIITVKDGKEVQQLFLNKTVQILIGEKNELENFQYIYSLCKTVILPLRLNSFGFSFGFRPGSPLFKQISQILLEYQAIGFMDLLTKSYIRGVPKCSLSMNSNNTNKGYGIENVSGCFVFMGVGFFVSLLVLFLEHILFRLIVPQWRNLPETSKWKSISVLFISQRLHRVIHSERLIKPTETTREMIAIVRNREFHKIFFKENMHKPVPSRIISPTKISVFDISSEMVKMKRRSFESIAAFENSSNHSSFEDMRDNVGISSNNSDSIAKAPLVSMEDEDLIYNSLPRKQMSDESHSNFSVSSKYSKYKWKKKPMMKMSEDSINSTSSFLSTESKSKYSKNPKLFLPLQTPNNSERKAKTLLRMQCLDQD